MSLARHSLERAIALLRKMQYEVSFGALAEVGKGREKEDISRIIQLAVESIRTRYNISYIYFRPPNFTLEIHCNSYLLQAAFINLIDNAVQARDEKKEDFRVEVELRTVQRDKKFVQTIIRDRGIGIPKERIPQRYLLRGCEA